MATTTHPHAHPRTAAPDELSLARQLAAPAWTVGVIAVVLAGAAASTSSPTDPAWSGRIGPAALAVAVTPAAAHAQTVTLTFTRPRSGRRYDIPTVVRARLTPKHLEAVVKGVSAGGAREPLTAVRTGPGVWTIALAGDRHVGAPGTWRLRVSALVAPGHALKRTVPLTFDR